MERSVASGVPQVQAGETPEREGVGGGGEDLQDLELAQRRKKEKRFS